MGQGGGKNPLNPVAVPNKGADPGRQLHSLSLTLRFFIISIDFSENNSHI